MTIAELKKVIANLPDDMLVLVSQFEGDYDPPTPRISPVHERSQHHDYLGDWIECVKRGVPALILDQCVEHFELDPKGCGEEK